MLEKLCVRLGKGSANLTTVTGDADARAHGLAVEVERHAQRLREAEPVVSVHVLALELWSVAVEPRRDLPHKTPTNHLQDATNK